MAFGIDYSFSRPDINCLKGKGVTFACRYLRGSGKALSRSEAQALNNAGIAVVSNEETTGTQYTGGYNGGCNDARAAHSAHVNCGGPSNAPIYFTPLDHDPAGLSSSEWNLLRDYARGVCDTLGKSRVGWYGGTAMLDDLKSRGYGAYWWQALGWRAGIDTSEEARARGWHLRQYNNGVAMCGGEVDYDESIQSNIGAWIIGQDIAAEDDVTEQDIENIINGVVAALGGPDPFGHTVKWLAGTPTGRYSAGTLGASTPASGKWHSDAQGDILSRFDQILDAIENLAAALVPLRYGRRPDIRMFEEEGEEVD